MKKNILFSALFCLAVCVTAQNHTLNIEIVNTEGTPVKGAVISSDALEASSLTEDNGCAALVLKDGQGLISISSDGYYPVEIPFQNEKDLRVVLIPEHWSNFTEERLLPFGYSNSQKVGITSSAIDKKDMLTAMNLDQALSGQLAGLQVISKGGMPGEGAFFNMGGLHSLTSENTPLIVVNGVPYMPDQHTSYAINAYSRSLFSAYNINDIRNVTLLTGADAAVYGSLASNGVILIETEQAKSDILDTRISLAGQYGISLAAPGIDVLDADEYKNYLRSIGMTRYPQMGMLTDDYPFLQNEQNYPDYFIFNNHTDWKKEIYRPAFNTNNVFRVEGGDEIAKYNISVGYSSDGGVTAGTKTDRFHTLINSDILVTRDIDIFSIVGLSYTRSQLQEQGMNDQTNPMLASSIKMPVLSPYASDQNGNPIARYATYDYGNINAYPLFPYENVSNPLAIVNTLEANDKIYDVNIQMGLNYKINNYLKLKGLFDMSYRYTEENVFIPGVTNQAIYPQYYGIGRNTVRKGISEFRSNYYNLDVAYSRTFAGIHALQANAGARIMTLSQEYDISSGYNTANDFYKTLDKITDKPDIDGFNDEWVWANYYLHADYTYFQLLRATANLTIDASSASGVSAPLYYLYPSAGITLMAANLNGIPDAINRLNVSAEVSHTGNSRFSSNYAKNYYQSSPYFSMGSIIRSEIPNTRLEPEKKNQINLGTDIAVLDNRIGLRADFFKSNSYDLLIPQNISSVYAVNEYYENTASISTVGYSLTARFVPIEKKDFSWTVGGNIASAKSRITALSDQDYMDISLHHLANGEDAVIRLQIGEEPYQFYGFKTDGIYSSSQEAEDAHLISLYGTKYQAGDVRFLEAENHKDGIINNDDKVLLGNASPDFFGGLFTTVRYKNLSLTANFHYSIGNLAYNAVRRELESMNNFSNQSVAVMNRWQLEGQTTDMPRVAYGDPNGNSVFSDRWIEDASYLKLGSLTLSYRINRPIANLFQSGSLWISGQNLLTFTHYLGSDPELAYSFEDCLIGIDYAKVANPRIIKVGFNLNF